MVGGYGFQLSVSYRVPFDTVDRSLIGHYRTIAKIAGFQFFLHPQIKQHTDRDVFRLRNEFLFLIVSDCFSEQGFCFRLAFCSHKLFLYFSAAFIFDVESCVSLFTFFLTEPFAIDKFPLSIRGNRDCDIWCA